MQQGSIRWQRPEVQAGAPFAAAKNQSRITTARVHPTFSRDAQAIIRKNVPEKGRAEFTLDRAVFSAQVASRTSSCRQCKT